MKSIFNMTNRNNTNNKSSVRLINPAVVLERLKTDCCPPL